MRMCLTIFLAGLYLCLFHAVATAEARIYEARFVRVSAIIEDETEDLRPSPGSDAREAQDNLTSGSPRGRDAQATREQASVESGDRDAQINFSTLYPESNGLQDDYTQALRWRTEAMKWYHRAAERGDASAQALLASLYRYVDGVEKDHAEALSWLREAEEQGSYDAQTSLGLTHGEGERVPEGVEEALRWYHRPVGWAL